MKKIYSQPQIRLQQIETNVLLATSFLPDGEISGPAGIQKKEADLFSDEDIQSVW